LDNIRMNTGTSVFNDKFDIQFNATFDPYKYDTSGRGRRVNSYMINGLNKPARLTNASLSLSTSFSSSETKGEKETPPDNNELSPTGDGPVKVNNKEVDFSLPWSLDVSYNWNYTKKNPKTKSIITQSLEFSGDMKVTKKWTLGFSSGYDFTMKDLTFTSVNISRDLHCWLMTFSFVPFGGRQGYNFNINARAAILKDLKYNKRNEAWRGKF